MICNNCIHFLSELLKHNSDALNDGQYEILRNEKTAQQDESFWLSRRIRDLFNTDAIRCGFCHKRQGDVAQMIGKPPNFVCEDCISAMSNLLAEEEA
jgi:hypothetical protein